MKRVEFFYDYASTYSYLAHREIERAGGPPRRRGRLPADGARLRLQGDGQQHARLGPGQGGLHGPGRPPMGSALRPALPDAERLPGEHDPRSSGGRRGLEEGTSRPTTTRSWRRIGRTTKTSATPRCSRPSSARRARRSSVWWRVPKTGPIKAALKANTDDAIARGVFGAPTFFVGDQMFWGNDRLQFVRSSALAVEGSALRHDSAVQKCPRHSSDPGSIGGPPPTRDRTAG